MKTIEIEIPEGKKAEWVNGVLTLVDEPKKYYQFKVGDKAILNKDAYVLQVSGNFSIINAGTEVEIVKVFNSADATEKMYRIKHQNSTSTVLGRTLDKIEYKFNIGDRVTLVGCPLAVFTITDQIIKDGKLYYGVEGLPNCLPYEESELMPYGNKKVEHKFKVGDKVKADGKTYEITDTIVQCGKPAYRLKGLVGIVYEEQINGYAPQDITDRIKTFEDARRWCVLNNYGYLEREREEVGRFPDMSPDHLAYLKLRIITCALNEGWEPTYEMGEYGELNEDIFVPDFGDKEVPVIRSTSIYGDSSAKLCFKSEELAIYAATQFRDIYADFCGCKKGGEK